LLEELKDRPNLTVSADLAYVAMVKLLAQTLVPRKKEKVKIAVKKISSGTN